MLIEQPLVCHDQRGSDLFSARCFNASVRSRQIIGNYLQAAVETFATLRPGTVRPSGVSAALRR